MYELKPSTQFKKDLKLCKKRGLNLDLLSDVLKMLVEGETLPEKYRDHALHGDFEGCRECHILPDWLLIYEYCDSELFIYLTRTGSHSDLFN